MQARALPSTLELFSKGYKVPLTRIELHVHLDGAARHETLYELLTKKGLPRPGNGSLGDFIKTVTVQRPCDLAHFLIGFKYFAPAFAGDLEAIERISREFCKDQMQNGVLYFEARFSPHLMIDKDKYPDVEAKHFVESVLKGLKTGEELYKVKGRAILCCIKGLEQFFDETLALCNEFKDSGVVAIDLAGDEASSLNEGSDQDWVTLTENEIRIFNEAKKLGIHRTVHAGEAAPAESVNQVYSNA